MTPGSAGNGKRSTDQNMKPDEINQIAESASERALEKAFKVLGVDLHDQHSLEAFREDLRFVRRHRTGAAEVRRWIARSVITTVVCGTLWFLGQAVWSVLRQKLGN